MHYFARWLFTAIVTDPDVSWRTTLPGRWDIGFLVPVDAFKRPINSSNRREFHIVPAQFESLIAASIVVYVDLSIVSATTSCNH